MELEVFEILEQFSQQTTRADKIKLLQANGIPALRDVCRGAYDKTLEFNLPEGKPPYSPNKPESVPSTLRKEHRNFGLFVKGLPQAERLTNMRRETLFIQMLESIHAEDAIIVLNMVQKKAPVKGLTKKIVEEAFPNLLKS